MLRDDSSRLIMQMPHQNSNPDLLLALMYERMMQKHKGGQEFEQPIDCGFYTVNLDVNTFKLKWTVCISTSYSPFHFKSNVLQYRAKYGANLVPILSLCFVVLCIVSIFCELHVLCLTIWTPECSCHLHTSRQYWEPLL